MVKTWYCLIDANNFYASCEKAFAPYLRKLPVVVLSNNDGCVVARSAEAKKLGIPMGAVAFQWEEFFKNHNVQVFSSNYPLYGDMSDRIYNILAQYTPDIEKYSVDESFLKFEGFDQHYDLKAYALDIKQKVRKCTGIPISIGFGPTKALCKVANKIAKKFPDETKGVHIINTEDLRIKALKWLPIADVWGIGHKHAKRLEKIGVKTAYDFTQVPEDWVKHKMSIVGHRLQQELKGIPTLELEEVKSKKNIACTRSFERNYSDYKEVRERVVTYAVTASEKLRKQKSDCYSIQVFLMTNVHREDQRQYYNSILINSAYPTNSSIEIAKMAIKGLQKIFRKDYEYKKAGIIINDIVPTENRQIGMFENSDPKHKPLMKTIDDINRKIGKKTLKLASQDYKRTWKMRQQKHSDHFTTNLNDIIKVNCL